MSLQYLLTSGVFAVAFAYFATMLLRALIGASEIEAVHMALPF